VSDDKYVLVKAKGGMGNRMLCATTGLLYGELTGRKTVVDWRDASYSNDGTNSFGRFFVNDLVFPVTVLPVEGTVRPTAWNGHLDQSMSEMISRYDPEKHRSLRIHRKYSVDVRRLDYDEDILVFWNYMHCIEHLRPSLRKRDHRLAGLSTNAVLRSMLRESLRPSADVRARMDQFKASQWSDRVIGVHIRHTDRKIRLSKYEKPLTRFLRQCPKARIFLATDSQAVLDDYQKRFPQVFSTSKWFPQGNGSMHQNPDCPDKIANGIDALTDMFLLAECDYLIYPRHSTFSWISSLLSRAPQERQVDVDRFDLKVRSKLLIRRLMT